MNVFCFVCLSITVFFILVLPFLHYKKKHVAYSMSISFQVLFDDTTVQWSSNRGLDPFQGVNEVRFIFHKCTKTIFSNFTLIHSQLFDKFSKTRWSIVPQQTECTSRNNKENWRNTKQCQPFFLLIFLFWKYVIKILFMIIYVYNAI